MKKMVTEAAILLVLILCITGCSSTKTEMPSVAGEETPQQSIMTPTPSTPPPSSGFKPDGKSVALMSFAEDLPNGFTMYTAQQVQLPQHQVMYSNDAVLITVKAKDQFRGSNGDTLYGVLIEVKCERDPELPVIGLELREVESCAIIGNGYTTDLAEFLYEMMDNMSDGINTVLGLSSDEIQLLSDEILGPNDALTKTTIVIQGNDKQASALNFDSHDKSLGNVSGYTLDDEYSFYLSQDTLQEILDLLLSL